MPNATQTETPKKQIIGNWLLWWKIEPDELKKQVAEYNTLKFHQSARGISILCLLFSAAVTAILTATGDFTKLNYIDAGIPVFLCIFIYWGHSWAILLAMLYWTIEKAFQLVTLFNAPHSNSGIAVSVLIWWTTYMHAFYLAFKTEEARKARTASGTGTATPPPTGEAT